MELSSPKKLRRNWMLEQPLDFTGCSSIQFFNSPLPLTELVRLPRVTYHLLCDSCVTYGTLCHAIGHHVLPNQHLPREAEVFLRDCKYSNNVPLPTWLIYFLPRFFLCVRGCYGVLR